MHIMGKSAERAWYAKIYEISNKCTHIYSTQTYKSTIDHDDFLDDSGSITLFVFMKIYIHISGFKFSFILYSTGFKQSMLCYIK